MYNIPKLLVTMDGINVKFEFDENDLNVVFKEYGNISSVKTNQDIAEIE